jgi:peptide/nickel transport system permease protein
MATTLSNTSRGAAANPTAKVSRIRRLPPYLVAGSVILAIYLFVAITGPLWAPYKYSQVGIDVPFSGPSPEHWLGTDQLGRDVFSRVVYGTRIVMFMSLFSTFLAVVLGGSLGLLSGFVGGWLDELLMRGVELLISIPFLIFALIIVAAAGPKLTGTIPLLIGVVVLLYTPRVMRLTRSVAVDLVTRDFVTVARARGESSWSIVLRELAPNATGVLLVEFGLRAGWAPILIGTLGFLGVGVRPPTPEWGLMMAEGRVALGVQPIVVLAPAMALAGLVIGINLTTDGLARLLGRQVQYGK